MSVFIGIDLGTQSVRAIAADETGLVLASASHPITSTRNGVRHEQDPGEWWEATARCCAAIMHQLRERAGSDGAISGLAVDATSGTILLVDGQLRPLTPGLMYDDGRASEEARCVNEAGEALWPELSYRMQPSWALPKLVWLLRNHAFSGLTHALHQNDFINSLLAGRLLSTDSSNSLKTGYDLIRRKWPTSIFDSLNIPLSILPDVVAPGTHIGEVCESAAKQTHLPVGTPIFAGMTDGCAAQIASGATAVGSWNSVLGTTLVIKGVTENLLHDPLGVVYSHRSPDGFWLPGGASSTGAGVLAKEFPGADLDGLNLAIEHQQPSSAVVYPLAGEGERFPFAAPRARGFTISDNPLKWDERYLSILQGIAFIERLSLDYLQYIGASVEGRVSITGGATRSTGWNHIRSNVLQRDLHIPKVTEPAFGMAVLVAAHQSSIQDAASRMTRTRTVVSPTRPFSEYAEQYRTLVLELVTRGWLDERVGMAALKGTNS